MQLASEGPSWQVAVDAPMNLNFALFVRDGTGLALSGPFPAPVARSAPAPADRLVGERRAEAARAWPEWWAAALQANQDRVDEPEGPPSQPGLDPPEFRSLAGTPELRQACRAAWPAFHSWWSPPGGPGRNQRLVEAANADVGGVVDQLERELGRRARAFTLGIDVVESGDPYAHRPGDRYAVVAASLWRDADAVRPWLRTVVAALL